MKVRVTYELSFDERIAIGLDVTGQLIPCTQAAARIWFEENPHDTLKTKTLKVKDMREQLSNTIRDSVLAETDGE